MNKYILFSFDETLCSLVEVESLFAELRKREDVTRVGRVFEGESDPDLQNQCFIEAKPESISLLMQALQLDDRVQSAYVPALKPSISPIKGTLN